MENKFVQLFLTPNRFFQEKLKDPENLRNPTLIVLIVALIGAISAYYITQLTLKILPPEIGSFGSIAVTIAVIGGLLMAFVMWALITVIFFVLSLIFKGSGSFKRTLEFVGYGFTPQIVGGIINVILTYYFVTTAKVSRITNINDITAINTAMKTLMNSPSMQLVTIIGIVFMIWSANIWIFSIKHGRNLETKNAAFVVLIPLVIYIAYTLMNLTTLFGGIS